MTSAILFESRNSILATIQDNWQCNLWLYIDSTKKGTSMLYNGQFHGVGRTFRTL